jgi:putative Mg2+ transporter-C (MgtC) family protein
MDFLGVDPLQVEVLGHVALAMLLGAAIGLEREIVHKPAGLRTHMLVTGAAALLVALGDIMVEHFDQNLANQLVRSDPIRTLEAVITGVSFLGAGTIFVRGRGGQQVEGLTTAASVLFSAGVGVCVALSQLFLAISLTFLILLILRGLGLLEGLIQNGKERRKQETE